MFTGLVEAVGEVVSVAPGEGSVRLRIAPGALPVEALAPGDSVAVNGVCLTVAGRDARGFDADVSRATLDCTTLGELDPGTRVNLERALALGERLGGHLVTGHVDGVARVVARTPEGDSERLAFEAPAALARYIARKGSVCVDGVSLTVNAVQGARFEVQIVPHTRRHTIVGEYCPGRRVNLEVDLLARYLERLLDAGAGACTGRLVPGLAGGGHVG